MRARETSVDIFIILLFWISQKYNFASPARNTQNWIQFGDHLVSYDDAVMHVAMLMDRCAKWSWCLPPLPPSQKKCSWCTHFGIPVAPSLYSASPALLLSLLVLINLDLKLHLLCIPFEMFPLQDPVAPSSIFFFLIIAILIKFANLNVSLSCWCTLLC